jgi:ABC-type Fe3+/spermidine/putrescine transport system ATPase subunit
MSDRIVVMNKGLIEQVGTPEEVYRRPESRFVASFLGQSNLLPGRIIGIADGLATVRLDKGHDCVATAPASLKNGAAVTAIVRAQKVVLGPPERAGLKGRIISTSYLGGSAAYFVDMGGITLQSIATIDDRVWREGEDVSIAIAPADVLLLDEGGHRLR